MPAPRSPKKPAASLRRRPTAPSAGETGEAPSASASAIAFANPLYVRLAAAINAGPWPIRAGSVITSSSALVVAAVAKIAASTGNRPVVAIAEGVETAEAWAADVAYFAQHPPTGIGPHPAPVRYFPALIGVPTSDDPVPSAVAQARLEFLTAALAAKGDWRTTDDNAGVPFLGVTSVRALVQRLVPPENLVQTHLKLHVGEQRNPETLVAGLVTAGFVNSPMVEWPGEISHRGGIVDIFPFAAPNPWRIEFFGDEIASLRAFDAMTQTSFSTVENIDLFLSGDPLGLHGDAGKLPPAASLLDYLPASTIFVTVEPQTFHDRAERSIRSWGQKPVFAAPSAAWDALTAHDTVQLFELPVGDAIAIDLATRSSELYSGEPDHCVTAVAELAREVPEIRILARTDPEAKRMRNMFVSRHVPIRTDDVDTGDSGGSGPASRISVAVGDIEAGFVCLAAGFACLPHAELLQKTRRRRTLLDAVHRTEAVTDYLDLSIGDFVVHVTHGIARYRGMQTLARDGITDEYLELEFDGNVIFYVPVASISLVQKYIGAKGHVPELSKLGGKRWNAKKAAVEDAIRGMASEFLQLQAERATVPGIAIPADDDEMVQDFLAAFPFEETPDQERADKEISADMRLEKPMDRLLCGDVGYGKTEVAMRAIMRTVATGLQAAILVPTTVLAEQHFATFSERFAAFPITIERLSRFRTPSETREILARVNAGGIDVLIGTHRLLSKDVHFANLGLVVVDEEQRFGVEHKERLKVLRRNVDVLTMTATPIPRTLHMALLGIRDISNLTTPPHERLAVHTEVRNYDPALVAMAIRRELDRDGQVFFVHNRVQDIELVAGRVQQWVPEARVDFAHGQMPESRLQAVMERFVGRKIDVLVATTIVESGLDIPTANTLFVNRADRFGLAELHQLRGRVGRYKHRAYAYFMVDPHAAPNPVAKKRLRAIAEFSHLGAGFNIAMRDLEIRGAGNIIGHEQSGHIAAVGYDLYCKLLHGAIAKLKNETPELPTEGLHVSLNLGMDMRVPERFIPDRRQRLEAYRRLFGAESVPELRAAVVELRDRYGAFVPEVRRLIDTARLRIVAGQLGVTGFRFKAGEGVYVTFSNFARLEPLLSPYQWRTAILDGKTLIIRLDRHEQAPDYVVALLLKIFSASSSIDSLDADFSDLM